MAQSLPMLMLASTIRPASGFAALAQMQPGAAAVFFQAALWLAALPASCIALGSAAFGWRLGAEAPLHLEGGELALVAAGYFLALLAGLLGTAALGRWMASTYGAAKAFGAHLALVCVVAMPLALGSLCHLFPDAFLNLLVLIPALIWSAALLYRGVPALLGTGPERGMLMASALLAVLLVGAVTLLGVSVGLWGGSIGPALAL